MSAWSIGILSGSHDRSGFDGGVEVLNDYLQRMASQEVKRRACAVYVASPEGTEAVAGYYTINASSARFHELMPKTRKPQPFTAAIRFRISMESGFSCHFRWWQN